MNTNEKAQKSHHCKICNKIILGGKFNLKSHLYQHGLIRPRFKCSLCPKEYFRRDTYDKHQLAHEGKSKKQFICDHCERGFVDKRNLILHLKIHDDLHIMPRLDFKCTACGVVYCENRLLKHHIRKNHFGIDVETKPDFLNKQCNETWVERVKQTEVYVEMTKVNENVLKIKKYDVKFESRYSEETTDYVGKVDESSNEKVVCDYCKQEMLKSMIEYHISKVHNKHQRCHNCKITISHTQMNHVCRISIPAKDKSQYSKAVCDYCKKVMLKKSLKSHIRETHLNLKRFKCEECNENFNRHYQLVNHLCGKYKSRKTRKQNHKISKP